MSKTIAPEATAHEAIGYKEAINQMLTKMKRANKQMQRDQDEIERLKKQTRETLARIEARSVC